MAFVELDDVRLHYELSGQSGAPVLVLSNSLGTDLSMWAPQLSDFLRHFQLLRYDGRGHGQSSTPVGPYNIGQLGADVIALLDYLHIDRASFCGISMGGMVAQWLGLYAADRISRLVLANTAAKIGTFESWNTRIEFVRSQGIEAVIPAILERWYTPEFSALTPEMIEQTRAMLASTSVAGYIACCAAVRDADYRTAVSNISIPALILCGTYDSVTPPVDGHFLQQHIPGSKYLELKAAHLSSVEAASDFNSAVLQFLLS